MTVIEEREAAIQRREAEETLKSKHPDFEDIRGDDNFHNWAKEQPEQIQDWIYNNPDNVSLAVKAIDLYKMENGIKTSSKQKTKKSQAPKSSAADMVSTRTTQIDAAAAAAAAREQAHARQLAADARAQPRLGRRARGTASEARRYVLCAAQWAGIAER